MRVMSNDKIKLDIPKVIHYCWFSNQQYPSKIQKCIDSWKKFLPEYELKLWNYSTFPKGKSQWVDEAIAVKKYAFAADYIRAYALYTEGGIYLDSDVEVLKSFDPLLHLPYFIGRERGGSVEAAVMGSEKGLSLFKYMLDYYDNHKFIDEKGNLDLTPMPSIFDSILDKFFNAKYISTPEDITLDEKDICLLPWDYFSPMTPTLTMNLTENTVTIHHFSASWEDGKVRFRRKIKRLLGSKIVNHIQPMIEKIHKLF